jgi:hypothetical protein
MLPATEASACLPVGRQVRQRRSGGREVGLDSISLKLPASCDKVQGMTKSRLILLACLVAYLGLRVYMLFHRYLIADETEHLHAAWCMAQGMTLYKDFFEHHGPLWYLFLQWIPAFVKDPIQAIYAGRSIMLIFWSGIAYLQWRLTARWDRPQRIVSLIVLLAFTTSARSSVEIRPDVLAALLISFLYVLGDSEATLSRLAWMGLCFGASILCSPKAIFPGGGFLVGWWLSQSRQNRDGRAQLQRIAYFLLGAVVPVIICGLYFWRRNALHDAYAWFIVFNRHLVPVPYYPKWSPLLYSFMQNSWIWLFAGMGLYKEGRNTGLIMAFIATFVGLLVIRPIPVEQDFLFLGPLLAYFAAAGIQNIFVGEPASLRLRYILPAVLLGGGFLYSAWTQASELKLGNDPQLESIRIVEEHTQPSEIVMGPWTGDSVFRPHAHFFSWMWPDIEYTLGPSRVEAAFLSALEKPEVRWVIWNPSFFKQHPGMANYVQTHFQSAGFGQLYKRSPTVRPRYN